MLTVKPLAAFTDNYIWLLKHDDGKHCVVVDPGDANVVIDELTKESLILNGILITHHHNDHTGGVDELKSRYKIPVYGPENSPYKGITQTLSDGDTLMILNESFEVLAVPGHTLDHIAFYTNSTQTPKLFCGDTLFLAGCGRLFEGSPAQMLTAMDKFRELPPKTEVYCTHEYSLANLAFANAVEPNNGKITQTLNQCKKLREQNKPTLPSSIEQELAINPFMRTRKPSVVASAKAYKEVSNMDEVAVFSAIREWKNSY